MGKIKRYSWVIVLAALAVAAGGFYFYKNRGEKEATLVVHPGPFVQQVSVSGKVKAVKNVELGFAQSGRVSRVYAAVGEKVSAGSLIAEIENGDLSASVLQKEAALVAEEAKLRSLMEGTRPEDISVSQVAVNNASNDVTNAIKSGYLDADDAIRNKVDQFFSNPKSQTPQLTFGYLLSDSQLKNDIETGRPVIEGKLLSWNVSMTGVSPEEQYINEATSNLRAVQAYLGRVAVAVNSLTPSATFSQATIDAYKAAVLAARTNVADALDSLSSAADSLKTAQSELALKMAGTTASDVDAQRARVKSAEADVKNAEAQLAKTRIFAPFSGIITKMDAKAGEIASPSASEISMISSGNFQVESYVPEINVALISPGNSANVTLDAYGGEVRFAAKVISVDPAETIRDGVSTYKTMLEFLKQDDRIKSGMTANVIITTKEKTGVISIPQKVVTPKDGKKYVNVKEGKNTAEREVVTGDVSSLGEVEILKGLSDGDMVIIPSVSQ